MFTDRSRRQSRSLGLTSKEILGNFQVWLGRSPGRSGQIVGQIVGILWADHRADRGHIVGRSWVCLQTTCSMDSVPNTMESLRKILIREETSLGLMVLAVT